MIIIEMRALTIIYIKLECKRLELILRQLILQASQYLEKKNPQTQRENEVLLAFLKNSTHYNLDSEWTVFLRIMELL